MDKYSEEFEWEEHEKPINWRELFEKNIVYWKWIVISTVLFLVLGALYSRMQPNQYELTASVLVTDQSKSGSMNELSVLKQLNSVTGGSSSSSFVNDEEQVLKSTALMKRVVNRLELYTIYSHRKFLRLEELYTAAPLYVHLDSASLVKLPGSLSLKITPKGNQLTIRGEFKDNSFELQTDKLPCSLSTPAGTLFIAQRAGQPALDEPLEVTINNPTQVAKVLARKALSTDVGKMVDVINLTLQTTNIQKGQDILNTLAAIYNQDAVEQINRSAVNTAAFIDERLKLLAGELSDVEHNVENYKQANNLTDIDADAQIFLDKSSLYDQQRTTVETQRHLIKYVEEFIHNPANATALIPNLGLTDVGLLAVIQKYDELVLSRDRIANGSSDENPSLKVLTQQIQTARKAIQVSIENSRRGLQITNNDLDAKNSQMISKIHQIPRQEREFIEIKRQQQVKETLYLFLLQKREEASLNMAVTVPKGRLINAPDDVLKVAPKTSMIMLVFLLVGLFIPPVLIYLRELFNTAIHTRTQVEKLTGVPVIAELGHNKDSGTFLDHKSTTDTSAELFRLLRTKLQFTLDYPTQKTILVTSTEPGEGKTFVSINLAINLSMADKKVLLIGMDLRKPQLAKYFNIAYKEGITSYLTGHHPDYKSLIHTASDYPLLSVLPAGLIPPNPNELMMKERLDALMAEVKQQYDYIVIDTAPVGAVSDTFLLNRLSDLTLYICRAEFSDRRNIDYLNRIAQEKNLTRLFLVINDVNMESRRYYYHRGYSYGYGKYYGHKEKK